MTPTQKSYYELEAERQGALYEHTMELLDKGQLTATERRALAISAKTFLCDHYPIKGDIEIIPCIDKLLRVSLAGLTRAEDSIAILTGYAKDIDAAVLEKACEKAGGKFVLLYDIANRWWGMSEYPTGWRCTAEYQRKVLRPRSVRNYRESQTLDNAKELVVSLLPLPECIHCIRSATPPTIDQAVRALEIAPKGVSPKACEQFILSNLE